MPELGALNEAQALVFQSLSLPPLLLPPSVYCPENRRKGTAGVARKEARERLLLARVVVSLMASHQQNRIQAYLEKNKIGPLFEVSVVEPARFL